MRNNDCAVVVLAAGKGTRLKSSLAKVLHRAGGRSLVEHVVRAAMPLKPRAITVVVGHQAEDVAAVVEPLGAATVLQQPQNGTGHAVLVARRAIGRAKIAVVIPGDAPLVRTETLANLLRTHRNGNAAATILTAMLHDPTGYGRIVRRGDGRVTGIVEEKSTDEETRQINEVNSSLYCFTLEKLWPALAKLRPNNVHRELYLTDAIALLNQQGDAVLTEVATDPHEILGCNTRAELAEVDRLFRARKRAAVMEAGVTIYMPQSVLIDPEVEIGADTILDPGVQLLGRTRIGARCKIGTGSILTDTVLGDDVVVKPHCLISASRLANGTAVGPFAHLRDGATLLPGARVGNFVEVKKSVLANGVKAMHLSYLGDARIGAKTNIGAGTITCNYDGRQKHPTFIGKRVFIGSDSALVAPVRIGDGAYVAAGSTITENVPADALGIARGRQVVKPGWAAARRRESGREGHRDTEAQRRRKAKRKPARKTRPRVKKRTARRKSRR